MMGQILQPGLQNLIFGGLILGGICLLASWLIFFILGLLLCVWVYRDAKSRGMEAGIWVLVVVLAGILGLIIYLVVRRDHSPYPRAYYPPAPAYAYAPQAPPPQAYRPMYQSSQQPPAPPPGEYVVEEYYVDEFGRRVPPPGY